MIDSLLYRENIIDHYNNPRNFGKLSEYDVHVRETNPLCGDELEFFLKFTKKGCILAIGFTGVGCAISIAAASMLTENLQGEKKGKIFSLHDKDTYKLLGVSISPARQKCALLAQNGLKKIRKVDKSSRK